MPELSIQEKRGIPWWAWLIGIILLALLIWWLVAAFNDNEGVRDQTGRAAASATAERMEADGPLPLASMLAAPEQYFDREVAGTARVTRVISDRGFWIEQEGKGFFVIIDEPRSEPININAGQTIRLRGKVSTADRAANLPGIQNLEPDARQVLNQHRAFLLADASNINIVNR